LISSSSRAANLYVTLSRFQTTASYFRQEYQEVNMATEKTANESGVNRATDSEIPINKIDRTAPAGSKNSLGAESVRDWRPDTDDATVEAMDEEGPDLTAPRSSGKGGPSRN
jgi:hypothetical protein